MGGHASGWRGMPQSAMGTGWPSKKATMSNGKVMIPQGGEREVAHDENHWKTKRNQPSLGGPC